MIWQKANTTYISGHRECEQSVTSIWHGTFEQYLKAQQQYAWLLRHTLFSIKFQDLVEESNEGRDIAIINGSKKQVGNSNTENTGRYQSSGTMGRPTCDTRDQSAFRSEIGGYTL
jgi:hypothetical protein